MNLIFYMHLVITALNGMWNENGPYESGLELGAAVSCSYVALSEVEPAKRSLQYPLTRQDRSNEGPCTNISRCLARGFDLIDSIG